MKIISDSTSITKTKTCVALGNFDGVHLGHRKIIKSAIDCAKENGLLSCIYTFSTHPAETLGHNKKIITDTDERIEIFNTLGCDIVYLDNFPDIRNMSPEEFCRVILKDKLNAQFVFCGGNYSFGYMGKGNTETLKNELKKLGTELVIVPYVLNANNGIVSSTYIRNLISLGNIKEASELMNSEYRIKGTVLHGKQLGRKLGFPTLNISIPSQKVIPKFGVYVSTCILDGTLYKGISNIGIRPTTDSGTETELIVNCETYLFEYNGDAYGKDIEICLCDMIREEMKFGSIDELKDRIAKDTVFAKEYFSNIGLQHD